MLEQRLGRPVCAANDAKCAANAEAWTGALADVPNGAVLVLGTGTGGAIVLNHQIWMGNTFAAGELSFLPTRFQGITHSLRENAPEGWRSLWGSYASATGLLRAYAARKGISPEGLDGLQFFAAYDAGEPEAAAALEDLRGDDGGRHLCGPIVAGPGPVWPSAGGISARPEVTDIIRTKLDEIYAGIPFTAFGKPEIVRFRYGNDANLIGALRFLLHKA